MEKGLRNVLLLGIAFMLYMCAFVTLSNIQQTLTDSIRKEDSTFKASGYYGEATNNLFFAIFNWASPSVLNVIGPKFSICIGVICNIIFILQFLLQNAWTLYSFSALLGIGQAILWTGQGNYLTLNSTEKTIARNSGILSTLANSNMIFGNLIVMYAFHEKEIIDKNTRMYVLLSLTGLCSAGLVIFLLLPKPDNGDNQFEEKKPEGPLQAFYGAVKMFFTKNILFLCFIFLYEGLELGFFNGVYGSCIGFTKNLENRKELVGTSGIFVGIGEIFGCGTFIIFGRKLLSWNRSLIACVGGVVYISCYSLIFINLPNDSPFSDTDQEAIIQSSAIVAMFCSFLLGLGDSICNNLIITLVGTIYADNSAPVFAILQFFVAIGALVSFVIAQSLGLYYQLSILSVMSIIGTIGYIKVSLQYKNVISTSVDKKESKTDVPPMTMIQTLEKF